MNKAELEIKYGYCLYIHIYSLCYVTDPDLNKMSTPASIQGGSGTRSGNGG